MKIKNRNIPHESRPHPSKNRINKLHLAKRIVVNGVSQLCPVACSNIGEPKADWVVRHGKEEFRPAGSFYLEWWERSRRRRMSVGDDYKSAIDELLRKEVELQAIAEDLLEHPDRQLSQAVEEFLEEVKLTKEDETWSGYDVALRYFQESCKRLYVTDIERIDVLRFISFLREEKRLAQRTVHNRFACVLTFLEAHGLKKLIKKNDRPRFVSEEVEIYENGDLEKLYPACSLYHRTLYDFLLMSGFREQEAMYTTWQDVNWEPCTINMRWKPRYNWTPKANKEREVPVPTKLLDSLKEYRAWLSKGDMSGKRTKEDALIFSTASGEPQIHMLRALKRDAKRAKLDPGKFGLHKFRATFATMHLQSGVDLRTVMEWMGQTNLESVIRYLKPARNETMRKKVNATFAKD